MEKVGPEFLGATEADQVNSIDQTSKSSFVSFPRLEVLEFSENEGWEEWIGYCGATTTRSPKLSIMPCLEYLEINECVSLETLPDFQQMIPIKDLYINDCEILKQWFQNKTGREWFKNSNIQNILIDEIYVQKDGLCWT
ncbi:LRR domain containing protein [Trema orientale]|uniref:LRR domain containing protein n=1 Tax=Trema orientale TaxID=63057 RepID=A0A2P5FNR0_TREOI|nr:LRR domain containing protein [Trema orientale]